MEDVGDAVEAEAVACELGAPVLGEYGRAGDGLIVANSVQRLATARVHVVEDEGRHTKR